MAFFRLGPSKGDRPHIVCYSEDGFENKYGINARTLFQGNEIGDWNDSMTFSYDPSEGDTATDFLINNLQWVLISNKVRSVLQDLGVDHVQYLPVHVRNVSTGTVIDGYTALNVTRLTDALDLENSVYMELKSSGRPLIIVKKFALSAAKLEGQHVVRVQNQPNPLFLSEYVVNGLLKAGATGCDFWEVKMT
ncbi:MAG: hypothetical protein K6T83_08745 [Alicyclobacillus sp.]|nr:hypothetical protein [Alicyclobacillus sp.]